MLPYITCTNPLHVKKQHFELSTNCFYLHPSYIFILICFLFHYVIVLFTVSL